MDGIQEKVEKTVNQVDAKLAKKAAGERSLSVGELIFTGIGVAAIAYALWKLTGNTQKAAIAAGLVVIGVGELIW